MIYLKSELAQFQETKDTFAQAFRDALGSMWDTFQAKAKTRDVGSPLHHRYAPRRNLEVAQAKARRIESLTSVQGWERDPEALAAVLEECYDAANYLMFIAALCLMLQAEGE